VHRSATASVDFVLGHRLDVRLATRILQVSSRSSALHRSQRHHRAENITFADEAELSGIRSSDVFFSGLFSTSQLFFMSSWHGIWSSHQSDCSVCVQKLTPSRSAADEHF